MPEAAAENKPTNRRNALTLTLMILVFALPPLAAYFMYFTGIMPEARMNKGTLIKPVALPEVLLRDINGQPFNIAMHSGRWTMLLLVDSGCVEACKKNIYLMRQVRTALGKDRHNTERLLIVKGGMQADRLQEFLIDYPGMPVITGNADSISNIDEFLKSIAGQSLNKVFLLDPFGRVMMHYPVDLEPDDLLSDLKRLIMVNTNENTSAF